MLSLYRPDNPANEYRVFAYVKGFPIDLSAVLVAVHVAGMLACTVAFAVHPAWTRMFICTPQSLFEGRIWQFVTYPFFHDIATEHIWFVISMAMLIWFGRPIESTIGTLSFGVMYAACAVIPVFLIILLGSALPDAVFAGSTTLHFAIFVGFALLFPGARIFFNVEAKWLAIIFLAVDTLACLGRHTWATLLDLWLSVGVIYGYLSYIHAHGILTRYVQHLTQRPRPQKTALPRQTRDSAGSEQVMDSLLKKISLHGIDSLTPEEKRKLEDARRKILDKKKRQ